MASQLLAASIEDIGSQTWQGSYTYKKDGNINQKQVNSQQTDYEYDTTPGGSVFDSDIMTKADTETLTWNKNGQLKEGLSSIDFEYNWDGKLRKAVIGADYVHIKYDPLGNRTWMKAYDASGPTTTTRKYIVDISGQLPTILCEINPATSSLTKSYIYTDTGQIICQRNGSQLFDKLVMSS